MRAADFAHDTPRIEQHLAFADQWKFMLDFETFEHIVVRQDFVQKLFQLWDIPLLNPAKVLRDGAQLLENSLGTLTCYDILLRPEQYIAIQFLKKIEI